MHPDLEPYLVDFDTTQRKENFRLFWFWYDWIKHGLLFTERMDRDTVAAHAILCSE